MERTKRLCLPSRNEPRKKRHVRRELGFEGCMSCFQLFQAQGSIEEDKRLPMAPCSGCGCQICLKCVRLQHIQDCMYRRNQSLAKCVACPSPDCRERRSFNAVEPILNELACFYMDKNNEVSSDRKEECTEMDWRIRVASDFKEARGLSEQHLAHIKTSHERMVHSTDSSDPLGILM